MPTERIAFTKQLDILRAFAVAAADGSGSASNNMVAERVKMSPHTVVLTNPFFVDAGFLSRADRGRFAPAAEVTDFSRAHGWTPATAGHRLGPIVRRSWFGDLMLRMTSVTDRSEQEVLTDLAAAAGASPEHRAQLESLVDYAVLAGVVEREGGNLRQVRGTPQDTPARVATPSESAPQRGSAVATTFDAIEGGGVRFTVDVDVKMSDFADWHADRIAAFFNGIAQALAAKSGIERKSGGGS